MKAMVLAAGLGTRLRPLTNDRPKALVEVAGRTLLEITLTRLRTFGISDVIINVHHFADLVVEYLRSHDNFGINITISREDDLLLDTGGGLKRAAWFFENDSEPFIVHNVDVISTIDLARMLRFHRDNDALATLAVQDRATSRYLLFQDDQLIGRRAGLDGTPEFFVRTNPGSPTLSEAKGGTAHPGNFEALAFSGIHIISPRLLPMLTEDGAFPIIPAYLRLAAQGEHILGFRADQYYWRDLGKPEQLRQAADEMNLWSK